MVKTKNNINELKRSNDWTDKKGVIKKWENLPLFLSPNQSTIPVWGFFPSIYGRDRRRKELSVRRRMVGPRRHPQNRRKSVSQSVSCLWLTTAHGPDPKVYTWIECELFLRVRSVSHWKTGIFGWRPLPTTSIKNIEWSHLWNFVS